MHDMLLTRCSATCEVLYTAATCSYDLFIMLSAYGGEVCRFCGHVQQLETTDFLPQGQ